MIDGMTIKEFIWKGGLLQLSVLPQLPGVPHLHVNRVSFSCVQKHILG